MSTWQGCTDDSDVVERFKEALMQRVGQERYQIWFSNIGFRFDSGLQTENENTGGAIVLLAHGQFAADRLIRHYMSALRGAAASVMGSSADVKIEVDARPAKQVELPFESKLAPAEGEGGQTSNAAEPTKSDSTAPTANASNKARSRPSGQAGKARVSGKPGFHKSGAQSLNSILRDGTNHRKSTSPKVVHQRRPLLDGLDSERTENGSPKATPFNGATEHSKFASGEVELSWESFVGGQCNELARTACKMAIENPGFASPLVLWGPPGSGKTHLLNAVAAKLRQVHRMPRVKYMAAEDFTNDFIKALNGNCLPAFRSRFRDADALLIDDIQFFVDKKATIRELHHTIEMLADSGKPLVFAGTKTPTEISGLGSELSGRLASGLVCQVESLDDQTRLELIRRYATQRCVIEWPEDTLMEIATAAEGDGRLLSGIVNLVALLQRMQGSMPTINQIRQHGGHLLRKAGIPITLSAIERAVEKVFQLDAKSLQSTSQTKSITEPRMLAMYLSREMTSSAFSEIGGHFGGRSHSTAILASQRVREWLNAGRPIGRGQSALLADEAIRRIESVLKTG